MRVLTLFGTRPEIIRLSRIMKRLDLLCDQTVVHTGQNYEPNLSDAFITELDLRQPDIRLEVRLSAFAKQVARIFERVGDVLEQVKPDRMMVLGDTNSGLAALVAARRGIPVYHLEAGNRCYDNRVPEETNRRVIDHCSTVLMPYTHRSKENLLREGIPRDRIFVIGNPIHEVLEAYAEKIRGSTVLDRMGVQPHQYFLATLHRAENVDQARRLRKLMRGLELVGDRHRLPVIVSVHPRTADRLAQAGMVPPRNQVIMVEPLGFCDFVALERSAKGVLTDSGTVQEECCLFRVPNVTLRDVTERAETLEVGSNMLTGSDPEMIALAMDVALGASSSWDPPAEYLATNVSARVAKIVLGYSGGGSLLSWTPDRNGSPGE
jgi:UDP-N-acetylglucosamine 2-epimerase (non-hydrolysing)